MVVQRFADEGVQTWYSAQTLVVRWQMLRHWFEQVVGQVVEHDSLAVGYAAQAIVQISQCAICWLTCGRIARNAPKFAMNCSRGFM